jgi:HK97 family phage portal protein
MGRLARAFDFGIQRRSIENPASPYCQAIMDLFNGGGASTSGQAINQASATRLAAAYRCVQVLSRGVASLPLVVMKRETPRGRKRVDDHPLSDLLHLQPNPRHTSYGMRQMMQANIMFHGNGYGVIRRDGGGRVREIWPVPSSGVEVIPQKSGRTVYTIQNSDGVREPWDSSEVLHVPGLNFDGIKGLSAIAAAREALGSGLALQEYGNTLFKRGGRIPGIITTPYSDVSKERRLNVRAGWDEAVGGQSNWHTPAVFPKGWDYKDIGIKPDEAQFLESKKFNVIEVCRFFGVNPQKCYDFDKATFTNIEHTNLAHILDDLQPWIELWEQEMSRKLLTAAERAAGLYIHFILQGILRGDTASRAAYYASGRQWGTLSANDVRELEDMPGIGEQGDMYLVPFNMQPADQVGADEPPKNPAPGAGGDPGQAPFGGAPRAALPPAPPEPRRIAPAALAAARRAAKLRLRRKIRKAHLPVIEDRAAMIVKREIGAIEKELKQHLSGDARARRSFPAMRRAIDDFYATHDTWAAGKMQPVLVAYAGLIDGAIAQELGSDESDGMPPELEKFSVDYTRRFGIREASEGRLQLLALLDAFEAEGEEAAAEAIQTRLDEWGQKRSGKIALNESVQFMGGAAKTLYLVAGLTVYRWVANPGACDFCQTLDGKVAGVDKNFVNAGQDVQGGPDSDGPMKPSDNIGHPPLHGACECDIVAD